MNSNQEHSVSQSNQPPNQAVPIIPSNAAGAMPALPLWDAGDYQVFATKESADKLAASAVAPLVAAARGYRHIDVADKQTALETGVGTMAGAPGTRFKKIIGRDGALYLPWFRPAVARREPTGRPGSSANQFRPVEPLFNEKSGKYAKYEFVAGQPTVLDIHPATPGRWLEYTPTVLITEGVLKGDSGMTGMLRAAGISDTELRYDDETVDALVALRALLNRVPEADRVMILSFGGVANWHAHPEWSDMLLKNRTVLVAFDGDLATNPNVYKQGVDLWKKLTFMGAAPKLLDLNVVTATAAGAESRKVGLDDYLAQDGPFESLAGRIRDELPPPPAPEDGAEYQPGDWRMNEDELISQEYREIKTEVGVAARWENKTRFIGRVSKTMADRGATDEEIETGVLASDADADTDTTVEVQVSFIKGGVHRDFIIKGPDTMLADQPMMWANKARTGGVVPTEVLMHRDWPPPPEWLSGVKGHREDDTEMTTKWGHMGWVPVENGSPVFIIGNQVIGRYGKSLAGTPGVTESVLAGATKFGVRLPDSEEEFKNAALQVWRAYRDGVWADPRVAALILAAALRPIVPKPSRSALLFSGGRGLGKSFSAGMVMCFYAGRPGIWTNNSLPGSAEDTMAATESALARTSIWVIDDWAPSEDQRKAAADSTKLGAIIRAVHNHTGKRRSNRDLTSQEVQLPRALLIITAEHEHNVGSVADRLIHVPFVKGSLGLKIKTDRVVDMQTNTQLAATVTGGAIQMIAAAPNWEENYQGFLGEHLQIITAAEMIMSGDTEGSGADTRHIEMAADLALGLLLWQQIFTRFGLYNEAREAMEAQDDLFSLCKDHLASQRETTPGASVVKALRAVLAAGQAHIISVDGQGAPPVANSENGGLLNPMLGWRNGPEGARGGGDPIGYLVMPPKGSGSTDPIILIHQVNGFLAAKRHHPELIMHGSQPAATWSSAWTEGFCAPYWKPQKSGSGRTQSSIRKMVNGIPVEGVPIRMSALLALDETASGLASDADE